MAKLSKRTQAIRKKVDTQKVYPAADALKLVKDCATAKFDESIDIARARGDRAADHAATPATGTQEN